MQLRRSAVEADIAAVKALLDAHPEADEDDRRLM